MLHSDCVFLHRVLTRCTHCTNLPPMVRKLDAAKHALVLIVQGTGFELFSRKPEHPQYHCTDIPVLRLYYCTVLPVFLAELHTGTVPRRSSSVIITQDKPHKATELSHSALIVLLTKATRRFYFRQCATTCSGEVILLRDPKSWFCLSSLLFQLSGG